MVRDRYRKALRIITFNGDQGRRQTPSQLVRQRRQESDATFVEARSRQERAEAIDEEPLAPCCLDCTKQTICKLVESTRTIGLSHDVQCALVAQCAKVHSKIGSNLHQECG